MDAKSWLRLLLLGLCLQLAVSLLLFGAQILFPKTMEAYGQVLESLGVNQPGIWSAFYVGIAVSNLINYMDPEMVILGGILIQKCPRYFDIVADVANTRKVKEAKENKLLVSRLGENAGVIGAGEIVADEFFNETVNEVFAKKAGEKT